MAEIDSSYICKAGEAMSLIERPESQAVVAKKAPVRVRLERINCEVAKSLAPDGDQQIWLDRLKAALGTASVDFVDATLFQLQAAARLPNSGISEIAVNAALALIEGEKPKGETEWPSWSKWHSSIQPQWRS
jgi:hypothetical protein